MRTRLVLGATGLVALLFFAGCGGDRRAAVSGKVTLAGQGPLPGGSIQFISLSDPGKVSGGQIKPDGTYEVPDAPVGECKVVIDNTHLNPDSGKGAGLPGMAAPGGMKGMKGMKGSPTAAGPSSGPKAADKAKMAGGPKGVDVPEEMNEGKADLSGQKYTKIDGSFTKADSTPLRANVPGGGGKFDFDVK